MDNFFQHWWQNKKILIIFGGLLAAVGITTLIPGTFLRIFPAWFRQIITSLSTELISIGIAIVLIDCFTFYQNYQRFLSRMSKFKRNFSGFIGGIQDALNDVLFEGNDFFTPDLPTVSRLEVFSENLKIVEGCPDPKNLLAFYRSFLPNVDLLVNLIPFLMDQTAFSKLNDTLDDLFFKALHLQRVIKEAIELKAAKQKNNGFAPLDFADFLTAVVKLSNLLARTPAK